MTSQIFLLHHFLRSSRPLCGISACPSYNASWHTRTLRASATWPGAATFSICSTLLNSSSQKDASRLLHQEITLVYICRIRMRLYVNKSLNDIYMSNNFWLTSLRRIIFNPTYICCIDIKRHITLYNIYSSMTYDLERHIFLNSI